MFQTSITLILLVFSIQGFCASPRLLITLGPKCKFSAESLHKKIGSHLIKKNSENAIAKKIQALDATSNTHTVIVKKRIHHHGWFARKLGYASLEVTGHLKHSIKQIKALLKKLPKTDKDLPRINPKDTGLFYDLLMHVDRVFKKHNLPYWATCGTLLGAIRHQGMIPWDDDIDIAIFETSVDQLLSLKEEFLELGISINYYPNYEYYQIFFNNGTPLFDKQNNAYPWKYPYLDVFPMRLVDGRYTYTYKGWQETCKNDYYLPKQLYEPLPQITFGPLSIPIPHDSLDYITRVYHEDWNRVAYVDYNHQKQMFVDKIKVELVDRSAPLYELP